MTDPARLERRRRPGAESASACTLRIARGLGLRGWVANESSGRVRVAGPRDDLLRLLAALRAGPPAAFVERVDEHGCR
jgi:acylphosphatase